MRHTLISWAAVFSAVFAASAAGPADPPPPAPKPPAAAGAEQVKIVRFTLRPTAEPGEALHYQLLPEFLGRRPGNAAVLYNKIGLYFVQQTAGKQDENVAKWLDVPLDQLPRDEVRTVLAKHRQVLEDLGLASRTEQCDWELPLREGNPYAILLPELQTMRELARLLALRARLQIAEGQLDDAVGTLRIGFAVARHVAEGPCLINGLVGIAISQTMAARVEELLQQPGAPSLYWALTSLPQPLIDLRRAMEMEMHAAYLTFPELTQVDQKDRPPEYWTQMVDKVVERLVELQAVDHPWQLRLALVGLTLRGYPQAKQALIRQGRSAAEVEAMPVPQVVALHTVHTYNTLRDEIFKWSYVPYWQAHAGLERAQARIDREAKQLEIIPLASLLLPAISRVHLSQARNDRRIAVLRTLDALRIHAAEHGGKPPASLNDVTCVPLPPDPISGQPFAYRVADGTAALELSGEGGEPPTRYEIRMTP